MWRSFVIQRLGGYSDIDSAIAAIQKRDDKDKILTNAVERLFNTVSERDILRQENGVWVFGARNLTDVEYGTIREQAKAFQSSLLFRIFEADVKYHCNKKMREAQNLEQLESAKMLEFIFDIWKSRLKKI